MLNKYKFEKFKDINFPVYASTQKGKGRLVTPHFHKGAELVKIIKGEMACYINTHKFTCAEGDIIFTPPYSTHTLISDDKNTVIEGIVFELSLIPTLAPTADPEKVLNKDIIHNYVISKQNLIYNDLNTCFSEAKKIYFSETVTYKLEMLSTLYKITALLISNYISSDEEIKNYQRLQPITEYIKNNLNQNILISDLSKIINVCDDHLIRLFKSITNKTPITYINDLRLEEAMKLLLNTELSVTEIAGIVGFSSANYMALIFKKRLGVTPLKYRKN